MTLPLVSVIIPAYNQAQFLGEAIESVLNQTYPQFELIVVNDASPDNSATITRSFDDPRITLLEHSVNRGLSAARNSGIRAAKGQIIAFLDADDEFLPNKLSAHVSFYSTHPETGATYNGRYELHYSSSKIRSLYRPPDNVELRDLVLGFPFAPSDLVLHRDWLARTGYFDERLRYYGEDQDYFCRLALNGCSFDRVDRALNLRRHHSRRYDQHFVERLASDRDILAAVFADPRCPAEVRDLEDLALANHLIVRGYHAFAQHETRLGREIVLEAVRRNPSLLDGQPNRLEAWLASSVAADTNLDLVEVLHSFQEQMPPQFAWGDDLHDYLIASGFLQRAILAGLWDYDDDAEQWLERVGVPAAIADQQLLAWTTHLLLDIDQELGSDVAGVKMTKISDMLERLGDPVAAKRLRATYQFNCALRAKRSGDPVALRYLIQAIWNNPRYLGNRGILSVLHGVGIRATRSLAAR